MLLTTGLANLANRDVEKNLSKKILLANTSERITGKKGTATPADPIYFTNSNKSMFNPDIRYRTNYGTSPITSIDMRNNLLLFSENSEVKKAIRIIRNEMIITNLKSHKYPVFPTINLTTIQEEKMETAEAIQNYLDDVFFPKLWLMLGFKRGGLKEKVTEYLQVGKLAWEIVYDSLTNPTEITNIIPIDPSTLQKFVQNDKIYFVQKAFMDTGERILHDNQVILIEFNKYEFGYISYADQLRRPFNIMRSMMTSKILWFAVKSQVRMHIKMNMGDIPRAEAIQRMTTAKNDYTNNFSFDDSTGRVLFNNEPDTTGYHEFFTAETAGSGQPEIDEISGTGPDLTEVDSLDFWEKYYWKMTDIPVDRIDPNSSETWSFTDVTAVKKTEINFSKLIEDNRETFAEIFLKPIIIQLTLLEAEIGGDLSLLDTIKMDWVAFNKYEKLAELEVVGKQVEIAQNLSTFGEAEDVNGKMRKTIPISWIVENYFDFTKEQLDSMEVSRRRENVKLGFAPDGTEIIAEEGNGEDFGTTKEPTKEEELQPEEENYVDNYNDNSDPAEEDAEKGEDLEE